MPQFDVIRVHEYHYLKVREKRIELGLVDSANIELQPTTGKINNFNDWRNYVLGQARKMGLISLKVERIFSENYGISSN